jgi:hypothetical protein
MTDTPDTPQGKKQEPHPMVYLAISVRYADELAKLIAGLSEPHPALEEIRDEIAAQKQTLGVGS